MGKGDSPRPVDAQKYRENWERIFKAQDDADCAVCDARVAMMKARDAMDELTRLAQEDGLYGPTEGT